MATTTVTLWAVDVGYGNGEPVLVSGLADKRASTYKIHRSIGRDANLSRALHYRTVIDLADGTESRDEAIEQYVRGARTSAAMARETANRRDDELTVAVRLAEQWKAQT